MLKQLSRLWSSEDDPRIIPRVPPDEVERTREAEKEQALGWAEGLRSLAEKSREVTRRRTNPTTAELAEDLETLADELTRLEQQIGNVESHEKNLILEVEVLVPKVDQTRTVMEKFETKGLDAQAEYRLALVTDDSTEAYAAKKNLDGYRMQFDEAKLKYELLTQKRDALESELQSLRSKLNELQAIRAEVSVKIAQARLRLERMRIEEQVQKRLKPFTDAYTQARDEFVALTGKDAVYK